MTTIFCDKKIYGFLFYGQMCVEIVSIWHGKRSLLHVWVCAGCGWLWLFQACIFTATAQV